MVSVLLWYTTVLVDLLHEEGADRVDVLARGSRGKCQLKTRHVQVLGDVHGKLGRENSV